MAIHIHSFWYQVYITPFLFVIVLWLGLTGGLIWLNRYPQVVGRRVVMGGLLLVVGASHYLMLSRDNTNVSAQYVGFAIGMMLYTWHELAFFCGLLTGPRPAALPPGSTGWWRLWYACGTHLYHDLALTAGAVGLWLLQAGRSNQTALLTFLLLWAMQHSAKLNVLLGVRNFQGGWLPPHVHYLASYWREQPMNAFFGPSLAAGLLLTLLCWQRAAALMPHDAAVGMVLLGTLAALAVVEHCLLVWPWPVPHSH